MANPSEILQALYLAGFELQTFERFPRAIGVVKGDCIALVESAEARLRLIGRAGWRLGDTIGVLTVKEGRQVFQSKDHLVEATVERIRELRAFEAELAKFLGHDAE